MADFKKKGGFGGGGRDRGERGGFGNREFGGNSTHDGSFGAPSTGSFGGNSGGFGGRSKFSRPGNREFRQTQKFSATCAECHKPCEVPFRPTGDRPVYCSYCFGKNKANGSGEYVKKDFSSNSFGSSNSGSSKTEFGGNQTSDLKKQLEIISSKLDRLTEIVTNSLVKDGGVPVKTSKKDVEMGVKEVEVNKNVGDKKKEVKIAKKKAVSKKK